MKKKPGRTLEQFRAAHNPDADVVFLRARVKELEAKHVDAKTATGEAMEIIHALREAIAVASPAKIVYKKDACASGSECTHVLHISDWHYGAVIDRDEVDGFGEFNPEIAERRIENLGRMIIKKNRSAAAWIRRAEFTDHRDCRFYQRRHSPGVADNERIPVPRAGGQVWLRNGRVVRYVRAVF